jgi:hypothetical protein
MQWKGIPLVSCLTEWHQLKNGQLREAEKMACLADKLLAKPLLAWPMQADLSLSDC